jgi:aarF domain-containing kinase
MECVITALPLLGWIRIFRLPELVAEFKRHVLSQIDLRTEADNLEEFRRNFNGRYGRHTNDEAVFPAPLAVLPAGEGEGEGEGAGKGEEGEGKEEWCAATAGLLVESLEAGVGLDKWLIDESDALQLGGHSQSAGSGGSSAQTEDDGERVRRQLAERGVCAFFQMVLVDNFVHADLHPGNILLRSGDGSSAVSERSIPTLVFLDAGLVVRLSEREKQNFADLFLAVALGEGSKAGELIVDRAPGGREGVRNRGGDPDRFISAIAATTQAILQLLVVHNIQMSDR